ncbi:MAG: hypothetical protein ACTSVI_14995 [Promethearchaeota archaeon]
MGSLGTWLLKERQKMVFIDWLYIEAGSGYRSSKKKPDMRPFGIEIQNFKPVISCKPILESDKPWEEDFIGAYISVVREEGKYKMWYESFPDYVKDQISISCYAESKDGVHWEKPNLGLVEWNESKENNIFFTPDMHPDHHGLHGLSVFLDKNPECPADEKYKLIYTAPDKERKDRYCHGAVSPDGIHWTILSEPIVKERIWADTQTIIEWNNDINKYVGFFRSWLYGRRQVYFGTSDDFKNWKNLEPVLSSDPTLPPDHDWYTNAFFSWPGARNAYFMLPAVYRRGKDDLYIEMRTSRDFRNWYKQQTNPIINPDEDMKKLWGGMYLGRGIIENKPDEWSFPIGVPEVHHNEERPKKKHIGKVYLASWRKDAFTGIVAEDFGEFWTQPISFQGNALEINALTRPGGNISIGLVDDLTRNYLPERELQQCDPLQGDMHWKLVTWNDEYSLEEYDDVQVRLHVQINRGRFHGIRFVKK